MDPTTGRDEICLVTLTTAGARPGPALAIGPEAASAPSKGDAKGFVGEGVRLTTFNFRIGESVYLRVGVVRLPSEAEAGLGRTLEKGLVVTSRRGEDLGGEAEEEE